MTTSASGRSGAPPVVTATGEDRTDAPRRSDRTRMRREEIVRAARDVFSTKGFRNGSLADIAERVGITHQGVLHHFGSKEQLLVEVLHDRDVSGRAADADAQHPRGVDFLHHILNTVVSNTTRTGIVQAYTVLSAESVTENHPAQEWFRDRFAVLRTDLADALDDACDAGTPVSRAELERGAAVLVAVMDGLQVQWLLDPNAVDMPATVRATIDALLLSWGGTPLPADPVHRGAGQAT
ncbi:MAG: helix-turn-helix domain-containing protein [Actinophytocola sp.]|uniref:TetR/AcrR family transcriptional regulator n=1 Tax=Actinophytocola sp. TaxID=1872138 RepID=UPI003C738E6B